MEEIKVLADHTITFSALDFLLDITLCLVAAFVLRAVYIRRSISLSGKFHIGTVIPILALVTFLVIMVVKSSLALSLGLVGALSVIRFRTPIKEPEELVYLFLAIAIGLGYGAHQTVLTTLSFVLIVAVILLWLSRTPNNKRDEYNLLVEWFDDKLDVNSILKAVLITNREADLLKYSTSQSGNSVFVKVLLSDIADLKKITDHVKDMDKTASVSFYEARPLQ